jgi:TRAP-type transport system periplasmic protein
MFSDSQKEANMKIGMKTVLAGMLVSGLLLATSASNAADVKDRTFRVAYQNPKGSPQSLGAQRFAEIASQKSDGKLKVRLFESGTLGGDTVVISALQGGTIDMTLVATGTLLGMSNDFGIFDLPFLFNDYKEVDAVLDGPVGTKLLQKLPEKGLIGLSYWDHGFRNLTNSKRPVAKLEDIQGLKVRVLQNSMYIDMFNTLGANAVPMSFTELYAALETKAMDGQENPSSMVLNTKLGEVQEHISTTRHSYNPLLVLFSKKTWDKLSDDERKILQEAAHEAKTYEREVNRKANEDALESLKSDGVTVTVVPESERERMREKLQPVTEKYKAQFDQSLVKEMYGEIEKLRSGASK